MKKSSFILAIGVLGTLFLSILPASASTLFSFSYSGSGYSGSGEFTANFLGGSQYDVIGVAGTADGSNITGLSSYAGADNQLYYPGSPLHVTFAGISFATANALLWNIWSDGTNYGILNTTFCEGTSTCGLVPIDISIAPVPLPAAVPLFAAGLSAMGFMGWRKRRKAA